MWGFSAGNFNFILQHELVHSPSFPREESGLKNPALRSRPSLFRLSTRGASPLGFWADSGSFATILLNPLVFWMPFLELLEGKENPTKTWNTQAQREQCIGSESTQYLATGQGLGLVYWLVSFFRTALLRYNPHTVQLTYLKWTIKWLLVYSQLCIYYHHQF